ncbi:non-hydrolyzing UDP-N-acetylglucosamine 2-epimerase [Ornithinimicrobium cryptoxanthini]|uniref:non-hydrolyzing UDP-N-acetylglucosamine 2-epimerase n=1 Tax=Ornithinimicrobium cryptoxanthini TaxID=2934161 RepID=UPI0021174B11|nr:UDP-N-acetylglucosamine 2-epimerase (non-hydrolyzing) [Ornithinimicrobium cryptoxanthini]
MTADRPIVTFVYGTRPEAIKCAPLVLALQQDPDFQVRVVVTGQHREMLDQVNTLFGIEPDVDLDIHQTGQTLSDVAVRTLRGVSDDLAAHRPAAVVVQGDTSSAFVAGLAAFYAQVPVVHLEAGLRTGDLAAPFPEEGNRSLLTRIAALHLAPTAGNRDNLLREGIDPAKIIVTGNSVIDALHHAVAADHPWENEQLRELSSTDRPLVLVTAHRRESWGEPMEAIGRAVATVAARHPDHDVALPAHANPRVREVLVRHLGHLPNVHIVDSAAYGDFCRLLQRARVILTDSGGVQEEGPALGKPVLVMRSTTERPEAMEFGTVRLVGVDEARIVAEVTSLLTDPSAREAMSQAVNPYGDGMAAPRAVAALRHWLGLGPRPQDFIPLRPQTRVGDLVDTAHDTR